MRLVLMIVALSILFIGSEIIGVTGEQVKPGLIMPDFSANLTRAQLDVQVRATNDNYTDACDNLMLQLASKDISDENKVFIIYLLGQYRMTKAVGILADNIAFRAPWSDPKLAFPRWTEFPATDALAKIGKEGSVECLKRLAMDKGEIIKGNDGKDLKGFGSTKRELYLRVVIGVEGTDVARFMFQNAIEKEQVKDKKANLTAAFELLDKWIKEAAESNKPRETPPAPPADKPATP